MLDLEALKNLEHFCGSEQLYKNFLGLRYTEGVKYLGDNGQCYWLIDAIASHQFEPKVLRNQRLKKFQFWFLHVGDSHEFINPKKGNKAILTCWEDTPTQSTQPAVTQQIELTDFPLPEIKLYVQNKILLLPSEN